ncbi:hypothetical protein [Siminovitchia fortis]|uniref:hypothetical protein n=1 Tax=Siminovitchia fortis TaxID=254758 RepID=UPI001643726D|nr:hypothetical protein [Siminovitchia fortis]
MIYHYCGAVGDVNETKQKAGPKVKHTLGNHPFALHYDFLNDLLHGCSLQHLLLLHSLPVNLVYISIDPTHGLGIKVG